MRKTCLIIALTAASLCQAQDLRLNEREYFERQGINVLVFSNPFTGGFNDEKNSGIEIIHHGVRTIQGGAVRLNNTPEQWDLVPRMTSRRVDRENNTIEVALRYEDYDFDSRITVTAKGKACSSDSLTTSRTSTTGLSSGDKTRAPSPATRSTSSSARR